MAGAMLETGRGSFADRYLAATCVVAVVVLAIAFADSWSRVPSVMDLGFAVALLLAVRAPLLTHARGDSIAITVEEVFLVPALALLEPSNVVVLVGVGVAAGMMLGPRGSAPWVRRRYFSPRRVLFNVAQKTLSAGAAAGVVLLLPGEGAASSIAAATAAAAAYAMVSRGLVAVMVSSVTDRPLRETLTADIASFVVASLILWAGGALVALATEVFGHPAIWVGLAVVSVLSASFVSNRSALHRERVAALLGAAQRISDAVPDATRVRSELERSARTLLNCRTASIQEGPAAAGGLAVPVVPGEWLRVGDPKGTEVSTFEAADRAALEALATIAAPALEHARTIEQLREADDLKAAVIASVSHDIRNPLHSALGFADLLAEAPELADDLRTELTVRLRACIGRVAHLVEGMLDLERYELGHLPEPADAEIQEVANRVITSLGAEAERISPTGDAGLRARIDARALERVIENLLTNALRHGHDQERVDIRWRLRDDRVFIMVDDAGPGIPVDRRAEIFEPFHSGASDGVGLGLWVARRFIELRGGRIWVENSPRGGAAFGIELPPA